jgi:ABC-type transport system involved in multi-copper enzyme maturation permease subunit
MIFAFSVPFTGAHWLKLMGLYGMSVLLFSFFIALGTLISTLTKRSQVSFLISLVCWVSFVFIIPRAGVVVAGQLVQVPSVAQTESMKDAFEKNEWDKQMKESGLRWAERNKGQENWSKEQKDAYRDEHMWQWMEEEEKERNESKARIEKYYNTLQEDLRNRSNNQVRLAFMLSRFSPVSAYQMAAMNIVATDLNLKTRYEDAINSYKKVFEDYKEKKGKASGGIGGVRIMMSGDGTVKIDTDREASLDLSDIPAFILPPVSVGEVVKATVIDTGILMLSIMLAFAVSFYSFLKYDLR